jgi:hypothetical protein
LDIKTFDRLCNVFQNLPPEQRAQLVAIAHGRSQQPNTSICDSLAALGLVRLVENKYIATEDGRVVSSLR